MKSTPSQRQHRAQLKARRDRVTDLRFMLETGVSNEVEAAHRLGITVNGLDMWCRRTGNQDIWQRLTAYQARTKDPWLARDRKEIYA